MTSSAAGSVPRGAQNGSTSAITRVIRGIGSRRQPKYVTNSLLSWRERRNLHPQEAVASFLPPETTNSKNQGECFHRVRFYPGASGWSGGGVPCCHVGVRNVVAWTVREQHGHLKNCAAPE